MGHKGVPEWCGKRCVCVDFFVEGGGGGGVEVKHRGRFNTGALFLD